MPPLRVSLFAEGSFGYRRREGDEWLDQLWRESLTRRLGLRRVERLIPISKGNLVALDAVQGLAVQTSSTSVGLDDLLAREIALHGCDAAVVAWDLQPPWDPNARACRWSETLAFYELLARSHVLPVHWRAAAEQRVAEFSARPAPSMRANPPKLAAGVALAVCMVPDFEALLCDEASVRRALGLAGRKLKAWPKDWSLPTPRRGDELLQLAVLAAQRARPQPAVFRRIHGDMRTAKHEWAAYILESLSEQELRRLREHPIGARLREVLSPAGAIT